MSFLTLVRHGQASFFEDDYDKLSPLGEEQSRVLGRYWVEQGVTFDRAYTGTLKRQIRTDECIAEPFREAGLPWPEVERLEGLNEYQADEIMDRLLPELCARDETYARLKEAYDSSIEGHDRYRSFHRLLEAVMEVWVSGEYDANGFTPWTEFRDGVRAALERILTAEGRGANVVVASSGGPIGVSVQTALSAPDIMACKLNWRIRNGSLTEFAFSKGRFNLDSFNRVPHLTDPSLLTYR